MSAMPTHEIIHPEATRAYRPTRTEDEALGSVGQALLPNATA